MLGHTTDFRSLCSSLSLILRHATERKDSLHIIVMTPLSCYHSPFRSATPTIIRRILSGYHASRSLPGSKALLFCTYAAQAGIASTPNLASLIHFTLVLARIITSHVPYYHTPLAY